MKKSGLLGAVCACASLFVFTSSNAAVLVGSSDPNVIDFGGPGITDVGVDFYSNNTIWLEFDNFGLPEDEFHISVQNLTGTAWTNFKFEFIDAEILQPLSIMPMTGLLVDIQLTPTSAWLFFDPPEISALMDGFGIIGTPLNHFTLAITPNAVPVPAAVWLFGSGLIGLIGIARRKK